MVAPSAVGSQLLGLKIKAVIFFELLDELIRSRSRYQALRVALLPQKSFLASS